MRTIIAGSRSLDSIWFVEKAMLDCGWKPTVVLSGTARGIDLQGEKWAIMNHVPVEQYPADWNLGKGAGLIRNKTIADKAEALVAIWDGESKGTQHMIKIARQQNLQVFVMQVSISYMRY